MLVVMAGLPGSGKSTLADALARRLGGVVLNKDRVRAELFPGPTLRYTPEQDDATMEAIYAAASLILRADPGAVVILDGRTFSKSRHVNRVARLGDDLGATPLFIECVCSAEVAEPRLRRDSEAANHPAANRTPSLARAVRAAAEPLTVPRLTLDTGEFPFEECVRRALAYLTQTSVIA